MTNNELTRLFRDIQHRIFPRKFRKIKVEFYNFRHIKHTIQWAPFRIHIQVSHYLKNAPVPILESLAIILLSRVYKAKVDKRIRIRYNDYVDSIEETIPLKKFNGIDNYRAKGNIFNLNLKFDQLNTAYFNNSLIKPRLGWSRNKSYRRLGFYDQRRNLLVISRIFDSEKVPEEIVNYLLYHEMLHVKFPAEKKNGRRIIHSPAFRKEEKRFPQFLEINDWISGNLRSL